MPIQHAVLPFVFVALALAPELPAPRALFENEPRVEVTESGMTIVHAPQYHVLVARVADDGSLVTGCANTEEAMRAMLHPPAPPQSRSKER
ncbi:MAG TPA: hypothetical protein VNA04_08435 [Thermoanaerobaculia bacterium]|nr:hypothetical protein [Thermoanaerobaculia bacterium]